MLSSFPKEYKKCPSCGCEETVLQVALKETKDSNQVSNNITIDMLGKKEVIALKMPPVGVIGIFKIPALIKMYDDCYNCGKFRLISVSLDLINIQSQPVQSNNQIRLK